MSFSQRPPGRFSDVGQQSGVETGLRESAGQHDTLNKKFIARNLKPYKTLKRFASVKGLKGLKGLHMAKLEQLAANAVLKKAKVKTKKLDTSVNRGKKGKNTFTGSEIRRAKKKLQGPDSYRPGSLAGVKNKRVRRAAQHLRQIRRNRMVNKTRVGSPKAYDIYKGYRRR